MSLLKQILYLPARALLRRRTITPPIPTDGIKKILLLRYDAIGDMIVTMPMVDLLQRNIPGLRVDVVTSPTNDPVVSADPRITKRFIYSRKLADLPALARELRRERYDMVFGLVMHRSTESGLVANAAATSKGITVFFDHVNRRSLYNTWFNIQIPTRRDVKTMAEMEIDLVDGVFGWKTDSSTVPIRLFLEKGALDYAAQQTKWMKGLKLALNISAKDDRRMLTYGQNEQLIRGLLDHDPTTTITVLSAPSRTTMAKRLAEIDTDRVRAAGASPTVVGALAITEQVDAVVTPDTSLAHGASAFGTPVVGMYTKITDYLNEWMPYGVPYHAIYADGPVPLSTLDIDRVLKEATRFIDSVTISDR